MTDTVLPAPSLPGTIPGLLRRGSPVVLLRDHLMHDLCSYAGEHGVCTSPPWEMPPGEPVITAQFEDDGINADLADLALDLSDPTGRTHAAWWAESVFAASNRGDATACARVSLAHEVVGADTLPDLLRSCVRGEGFSPDRLTVLSRALHALAGLPAAADGASR